MLNMQQNVLLAPFTTFHIGGPADFFVKATSKEELIEAVKWAGEKQIPFFILGQGANILVGDKGFRGLVIKNEAANLSIAKGERATRVGYPQKVSAGNEMTDALLGGNERQDLEEKATLLTIESGAVVSDIIKFTCEQGLSGFEHFAGIPSSIGGALWQNLHFLSPDRTRTVYIAEILESAEILKVPHVISNEVRDLLTSEQEISRQARNDNGAVQIVDKDYFNFSYDYSSLHDSQDVVLSATFALTPKPQDEIQKVIGANLAWRQQKHPQNAVNCSAGSVFKKIEGHGAGRLIEQVGLKGHKIGGAQISEKHANFIVNTGSATAVDVRDLISLVQQRVKEKLDLTMQPEISFVGEF